MKLSTEFKTRIAQTIKQDKENNFPSIAKQARSLGIDPAQLSRINKGDFNKTLSDAKWLNIAYRLDVNAKDNKAWHTAKTPTFEYIYSQLKSCQKNSISGLLCDIADIGKSHTAKYYAKNNKNAVYIDCSQTKTKQQLIRKIAKEFGITSVGRYAEVYGALVYYLNYIETPLIILDEAGDLAYPAFLELKAFWNATEGNCAWYMMGADGLKVKINRQLELSKVGYTEILSRFGSVYQKVTPDGGDALTEFKMVQSALIIKANAEQPDIQKVYASTNGSLRRIRIELQKAN